MLWTKKKVTEFCKSFVKTELDMLFQSFEQTIRIEKEAFIKQWTNKMTALQTCEREINLKAKEIQTRMDSAIKALKEFELRYEADMRHSHEVNKMLSEDVVQRQARTAILDKEQSDHRLNTLKIQREQYEESLELKKQQLTHLEAMGQLLDKQTEFYEKLTDNIEAIPSAIKELGQIMDELSLPEALPQKTLPHKRGKKK